MSRAPPLTLEVSDVFVELVCNKCNHRSLFHSPILLSSPHGPTKEPRGQPARQRGEPPSAVVSQCSPVEDEGGEEDEEEDDDDEDLGFSQGRELPLPHHRQLTHRTGSSPVASQRLFFFHQVNAKTQK